MYTIYTWHVSKHTRYIYIEREREREGDACWCVCALNADRIDCNVELIKMGDILISAGNKVFGVIFMGKMVISSCTPSLPGLLL